MKSIIVVDKNGSLKSTKIKEYIETELYKKAGCKTPDGFTKHATWKQTIQDRNYVIDVFGKTTGRAGQENKYDFPPPIDNTLFFGSCILVCKNDDQSICDLTESLWKIIYEKLFGGFEDIGEDDSVEDEEIDETLPCTKEGYVKDGFIVDDDEEEDDDDDDDDEDDNVEVEEEEEEVQVKSSKQKMKTRSSKKKVPENVFIVTQSETDNFTCTGELSEDSYD